VTGQLVGVTRGDGDHRWLALDAAPAGALDEDWIVLTIRDVTERIAARERKARSTATPAASEARFRALYKREHRMVRADGSVVSVLVDMTVVRDSDGRPTTTSCRSATSPIASAPKRRSRTRPSTTTSRACPTASCSSTG
jgi:PAS domain-containing protein